MSETCERCNHDDGAHTLIATTGNPLQGGIILCPEPSCQCFATWCTAYGPEHRPVIPGTSREDVFVPPPAEIDELRALIQRREAAP